MSYIDTLRIMDAPDDSWLTRLRRGHFVWMDKEFRYAKIDWAFEPPNPGCVAGRIGLSPVIVNSAGWSVGVIQSWYIYPDGTGFDGDVLLLPVKENCPTEAVPISEPWQRHVERSLGQLTHKLDQLGTYINSLHDLIKDNSLELSILRGKSD